MSEMLFWWWDRVLWKFNRFVRGSLGYPESGSVGPRVITL